MANCNGKTYPAGWTYSSNGYSGDSICGKCTPKTCSSGTAGLANCNGKAQPSGWTYSSNGYAGDSVCGTCTAKSCPAGYTAGTTGCSNTTSWTYGSNGYAGDSICGKCTPKDCADGYTAGLANCNGKTHPAGWSYTSGTPSGSTVCGKCTAKTCSAGSTSCDTATQNATANGYYAGDTPCYTCSAKTCEQLGKKTCNGSCIATSECCGGCGAGQECRNGSCINACTPEVGAILYADKSCSKEFIAGRTPIAVIFDVSNRLAVALNQETDLAYRTTSDFNMSRSYSLSEFQNGSAKDKTRLLVTYYKNATNEYPAAEYCYNYVTEGTNIGDWFLPDSNQLKTLYNNKYNVTSSFSILRRNGINPDNFNTATNRWYISGSFPSYDRYGTNSRVMFVRFNNGKIEETCDGCPDHVRPVLQF